MYRYESITERQNSVSRKTAEQNLMRIGQNAQITIHHQKAHVAFNTRRKTFIKPSRCSDRLQYLAYDGNIQEAQLPQR